MPKTNDLLLSRAKAMRHEATGPEARLWSILRAKQINGVKFSRQVVIEPYIADFVARTYKLVVELDGDTHATRQAQDEVRTAHLASKGYRVLRFTNIDVMENLSGVVDAIGAAIDTAPLPTLSPEGRGL